MLVQVNRISIYQNAKFLAVIYIPIGLIYSLIGIGFLLSDLDYLRFTGFVFLLGPIWMSGQSSQYNPSLTEFDDQ